VTFNLRYPGQYFDKESGLSYNYFRSYSPDTGRYTQADPIDLKGGWNKYSYVEGNPLLDIDPLGLRSAGPAAPGTYYPRGLPPRPLPRSDLPGRAANEGAANMTQTPNPGYPGAPFDLPCLQWDCSSGSSCRSNDIKNSTDFLPPARSTADTPSGCRCVSAGRDPAYQLPFDPKIDPYSNANDVRDNWRPGTRLFRR
jgi:RHS repeat-associated protein